MAFSIEIHIFAPKSPIFKSFNAFLHYFDMGSCFFALTIPTEFGLEKYPNFFLPFLISMTIVQWRLRQDPTLLSNETHQLRHYPSKNIFF